MLPRCWLPRKERAARAYQCHGLFLFHPGIFSLNSISLFCGDGATRLAFTDSARGEVAVKNQLESVYCRCIELACDALKRCLEKPICEDSHHSIREVCAGCHARCAGRAQAQDGSTISELARLTIFDGAKCRDSAGAERCPGIHLAGSRGHWSSDGMATKPPAKARTVFVCTGATIMPPESTIPIFGIASAICDLLQPAAARSTFQTLSRDRVGIGGKIESSDV